MPTYQYTCTACAQQLEVRQSFSDDPLTVCPACEGRLRKVFNAVGVVFKGSGFYKTDSRSGSDSDKASSDNGRAGNGGAGAEKSSTETKASTSATAKATESSSAA